MATYTIKCETGYFHISPFGFISYSEDFYEACCSHTSTRPFSPAKYYLLCRSIELSLKAFLLLKGLSKLEIKQKSLGHNLSNILKKCQELNLQEFVTISKSNECDVKELNAWYERKGFEYFEIENIAANNRALPDINIVQALALQLINSLKGPCKDEANKP